MNASSLGIGLAGFGTVGSGVYHTLSRNGSLISDRTNGDISLHVEKILVRDPAKHSSANPSIPADTFTTAWTDLVHNPKVHIIVELIGGTTDAFDIVAAALKARKPVVTGNKALLAERGVELFALSAQFNTPIHFEAAVAGGIPIIKTIQDSFIGNHFQALTGIINGTSNYILGRMTDQGLPFPDALLEAQQLGYAEADPALDINGWDAAHKAILLATLAYGFPIPPSDVHVSGIEQVTPTDIHFAKKLGYIVKLLAVIRAHPSDEIEIRIQPSFIPQSNILSSVHGVFNAISVVGDTAGESLFYGRGAGQNPTASSVVADLVETARSLQNPSSHRGFLPYRQHGKILPIENSVTSYYVRFDVTDRPGVIAEISQIIANHRIGISGTHSPVNPDNPDAEFVDMVFLLHKCPFGILQNALTEIQALDCINSKPVVFRIESLN